MEVQVQMLTDTLVLVSWERLLNIPEITHYTVFYSRAGRLASGEQSRNVSSTEDSVVIRNLSGGARSYQFVVIAVATVDNEGKGLLILSYLHLIEVWTIRTSQL